MNTPEDFKSAGKINPSSDFTSRLMQEIQREDEALESILRVHGKMETSPAFMAALAEKLETATVKKAYQPIFSVHIWWGLIACLLLLTGYFGFYSGRPEAASGNKDLAHWIEQLNGLFSHESMLYLVAPTLTLIFLAAIYHQRPSRSHS